MGWIQAISTAFRIIFSPEARQLYHDVGEVIGVAKSTQDQNAVLRKLEEKRILERLERGASCTSGPN